MLLDSNKYIERHQAFWSRKDEKRPLLGFTIGIGSDPWSYWKYNSATLELMKRTEIKPQDIHPAKFLDDQYQYLMQSEQIDDDIYRSVMPLASIPWLEAILGCRILSSGEHLTCSKIIDDPESLQKIPFTFDNPWIQKYIEFIQTYEKKFNGRYPISQSILRGPSDLANAILGIENMSMALLTNPSAVHILLDYVTDYLEQFLTYQNSYLQKFQNGYVIGQYEIWAPEIVIRFQEDASVYYSPQLYEKYLKPLDQRIASLSKYSLIHLHAPSLIHIEQFLEIDQIKAFQITKDPGGLSISEMLSQLQKIQEADKPLIIKGQFEIEDVRLMKKKLTTAGLCIQPVVSSFEEANESIDFYKNWK